MTDASIFNDGDDAPAGDVTQGPWPAASTDPVHAHVAMVHRLAASCAGKLVVASYGYNPDTRQAITPKVRQFQIGDVDGMTAAVRELAAEKFRNVYIPLCVMRADLPDRDKGGEGDVVAVLGLVGDFDDAAAADYSSRLPIAPNCVLETSAGRYQTLALFTKPLRMAEAKALGERLKLHARCDHGTADMSHVWRVPGLPNWPSEKKLKDGRSLEPQQVRVAQPWDGSLTDPANLDRVLPPLPVAPAINIITDGAPIDLASLSEELRELIVDGPTPGDGGNEKFHSVVTTLTEARHSPEAIRDLLTEHSACVPERFENRLLQEIERSAAKATRKTPQEEFTAIVPAGGATPEVVSPTFSDDAMALAFADRHETELRYVARWGQWLRYDGNRWAEDATLRAFDDARNLLREHAHGADKKIAKELASKRTVAATIGLAQSDRRLAATVDQWDADPWILGTPGGAVDLTTGKLRPHRREDYLTKMTAVAPGGECQLWHTFLERVTGGDRELQSFLQKMAGYALTGSVQMHALFFLFGTGRNGKGVFLNTLTGILADYAVVASIETFTASQTDQHPTNMAMLRGARLVVAQETEEGRRWAESKIKTVTGGDPITARFMRQDFFTFTPQFKLVIAGNHKPALRTVDEAIRSRFNMIPFAVTIAKEDRDEQLSEKLRAEWGGILQWAIDGCAKWGGEGLVPPDAVRRATDDYLVAEDTLSAWLDDCCDLGRVHWESGDRLFASWRGWADRSGEAVGTRKHFTQRLEAKGFTPQRAGTPQVRGMAGLRVHPDVPSATAAEVFDGL